MFKIEKDVPIPRVKKPSSYPFSEMEVGDSFEVVYDETTGRSPINARSRAACWKKRHPGWDYAARKTGDGKCRIRRTA